MKLENGILKLQLTNKGGEMASLEYKGYDVLYKGDGRYWTGKNPTLFPMISSPATKQYTIDGITYPCRNHGLIRYMNLETIVDDGNEVKMRLTSNEETLKEYPYNFEYNITYKLDGNRVLINYDIINKDNKVMPFTFGLHPGFIVRNFDDLIIEFKDDESGILYNQYTKEFSNHKLGEYKDFLNDLSNTGTVILKDLNSKEVTLKMPEYSVTVDKSKYRYLALWTADPKAEYICVEPWLSINDIKDTDNPFKDEYELEYLKPGETFKIDYWFEVN